MAIVITGPLASKVPSYATGSRHVQASHTYNRKSIIAGLILWWMITVKQTLINSIQFPGSKTTCWQFGSKRQRYSTLPLRRNTGKSTERHRQILFRVCQMAGVWLPAKRCRLLWACGEVTVGHTGRWVGGLLLSAETCYGGPSEGRISQFQSHAWFTDLLSFN